MLLLLLLLLLLFCFFLEDPIYMHIPSVVLVKFVVKPDAFLNISSKSKSRWPEITSARSASLMEWLINQASFLSLILTILSPTHRLLCFAIEASLYVFKFLLCCSTNIILYFYYLCIQIVYHNIFLCLLSCLWTHCPEAYWNWVEMQSF